MTQLIVKPLDYAAKGSYRKRRQLLQAAVKLQEGVGGENARDLMEAMDTLRSLLMAHLSTDDGTPVEAALDELSADEGDALLGVVLSGGKSAVPPESAET